LLQVEFLRCPPRKAKGRKKTIVFMPGKKVKREEKKLLEKEIWGGQGNAAGPSRTKGTGQNKHERTICYFMKSRGKKPPIETVRKIFGRLSAAKNVTDTKKRDNTADG